MRNKLRIRIKIWMTNKTFPLNKWLMRSQEIILKLLCRQSTNLTKIPKARPKLKICFLKVVEIKGKSKSIKKKIMKTISIRSSFIQWINLRSNWKCLSNFRIKYYKRYVRMEGNALQRKLRKCWILAIRKRHCMMSHLSINDLGKLGSPNF